MLWNSDINTHREVYPSWDLRIMHSGLAAPQVRRGTRGAPGRPGGSSHKRHCDICIKRPACARQRKHCIVTSLPFPSDTFPILAFLISCQYSYSSFCRHIGSTLHAAPAVCMDSVSPKRARCWGFPRSRSVLGFPKIDVGAGVSQDRSRESFRTLDVRCWGFPSQTSKGLECSDTGYPHAGD